MKSHLTEKSFLSTNKNLLPFELTVLFYPTFNDLRSVLQLWFFLYICVFTYRIYFIIHIFHIHSMKKMSFWRSKHTHNNIPMTFKKVKARFLPIYFSIFDFNIDDEQNFLLNFLKEQFQFIRQTVVLLCK